MVCSVSTLPLSSLVRGNDDGVSVSLLFFLLKVVITLDPDSFITDTGSSFFALLVSSVDTDLSLFGMVGSLTGFMFVNFSIAALTAASANLSGLNGVVCSDWSLFDNSASDDSGLDQLRGSSLLLNMLTLSSFNTDRF